MRSTSARLSLLTTLVVAVMAFAPAIAQAGTGEGTQNPDVTTTASLTPDPVAVGQPVDATGSVTNNTGKTQVVDVSVEITGPSGTIYSIQHRVPVRANQTYTVSNSFTANEPGTYTLTVSGTTDSGTSTATATTTAS